jgi:PIN domain nuclease of toxin-antitoxin system
LVKILLDSNALYWALVKPAMLGPAARNRIDYASYLCFSAASVFELTLKSLKSGEPQGRLLPEGFGLMAIAAGLHEIPLRTEHADLAKSFLSFGSGDPVDRMILAQALHENAILLTSDQKMLALGRDWIVDAQL